MLIPCHSLNSVKGVLTYDKVEGTRNNLAILHNALQCQLHPRLSYTRHWPWSSVSAIEPEKCSPKEVLSLHIDKLSVS